MLIGISGKIGSGKDTIGEIIQYLTEPKKPFNTQTLISMIKYPGYSHINGISNNYEIKKGADKLKDIVCILLNCTREQLEDREFKEKELGEEWWYYKYLLHESPNNKNTYPIYNVKSGEQEWKFIPKDFVDSLSDKEKEYHNVTLVKLTSRLLMQLIGTECGRDIIHPNIWVNSLYADYTENSNWIVTDVRFPNELKAVEDRGGITIRVNRPKLESYGYEIMDMASDVRTEEIIVEPLQHLSETALDNAKFDFVIDNNGSIEDLIDKVKEILITSKII